VRAACEDGTLDPERVESRARLAREAARMEALADHPASYVEKRRWRSLMKKAGGR
jgi:hypothetical protein